MIQLPFGFFIHYWPIDMPLVLQGFFSESIIIFAVGFTLGFVYKKVIIALLKVCA